MPKITGTFDADGQESRELLVRAGQSYVLSLTPDPSLTGSIQLLARDDSPSASSVIRTFTGTLALTEYKNETGKDQYLRLRCVDLDETEPEDVDYVLQSLISTGRRYLIDHRPKVGGTSGWVINAANNLGLCATLPASQTGSTLVVPVDNLSIGTTITGFYPVGQVESAGNTASITVELRKLTAAAADVVDATVATTGAVSFTADGILGRITSFAENLNATVADGESYYFLVTGTTAGSTDIALQGIMLQTANGVY
jgi:hypothetical protein